VDELPCPLFGVTQRSAAERTTLADDPAMAARPSGQPVRPHVGELSGFENPASPDDALT
jgi:hypothetical protein